MILDPPCTHHPRTTRHLSISWCSACQHWLVHSSQSGRRSPEGNVVLIEVLQVGAVGSRFDDPNEMLWFIRQYLQGAVELEHDRIDTDTLL